jgi:hypothetical protein
MRSAFRWTILALAILCIALMALAGPDRLYALWNARPYEGIVAAICPSSTNQAKVVETYLVELQTADRHVHVFASSDRKWVLIKQGDHVCVRLYPAPPWSNETGQWRDGMLLAKLAPPERQDKNPAAAIPQRPAE